MLGFVAIAFLLSLTGFQQMGSHAQAQQPYVSSCEGTRGTPRKYSDDVPCDIGKKSYCTEPGAAYPKHAVLRFVSDNQGLMRRMYGDLRHLSVLRSEMDWEEINDVQQEVRRPSLAFEEMNSMDSSNADDEDDPATANATSTSTALPTTNLKADEYKAANSTDAPQVIDQDSDTTVHDVEEIAMDKGISACPTKKEVVAPYWAVNTRGRTLAIVNDPPYEQHIHWEKCLHENQQMLCRDGCKCEQQQRLQRLLAFDPNCDCKGVFMDWFLLPSCCVCKCYGLTYANASDSTTTTTTTSTSAVHNVTSRRRTGRLPESTWKNTNKWNN